MKNNLFLMLFCSSILMTFNASADPLTVSDSDTVGSILKAHIGKRLSVNTKSGSELTGTVVSVNKNVVHLGALSGKEFYDAVVATNNIEAVVIRTK